MYTLSREEIIIRIIASIIVGLIIGYEREMKGHAAGVRTHILVAMGACLLALIQMNATYQTIHLAQDKEAASVMSTDLTRMTAQIVNGIGFLGAGTIILMKERVKGLTSAASIWSTAAIGIAMGMGYYFMGIVATVIMFFSLLLMRKIFKFPLVYSFKIYYQDHDDLIKKIESYMILQKAIIMNKHYTYVLHEDGLYHKNLYKVDLRKVQSLPTFFKDLYEMGAIEEIEASNFSQGQED